MHRMHRYKLLLAYDGTCYAGWQVQPHDRTVQQLLQEGLASLSEKDVIVHGSGRTDAGVHATGQVAHVDLVRDWEPIALRRAMNARLPDDIRVLGVESVAPCFHARKSAVGKQYSYRICQEPVMMPHMRLYAAHSHRPLDTDAMSEALAHLVGKHDFAAFSANPDRFVETTVRTIFGGSVRVHNSHLQISVLGDGFLYKMVRSIAGWLIRVGRRDVLPADTIAILASGQRTADVPTAPPQGLFLQTVFYEEEALASAISACTADRD